jgi:hypothetical protein
VTEESTKVAVEFTEQQIELVDRVAKELGVSREDTVGKAVEELIADLRTRDT